MTRREAPGWVRIGLTSVILIVTATYPLTAPEVSPEMM